MHTLKSMISRYMKKVTLILLVIILSVVIYLQITNEQRRALESATRTFSQMEQVLTENQKELEAVQKEYNMTCLHNAETITRIIDSDPDALNNVDELRKIAELVEVDEIHIFDKTGRVFSGTHPEYYNYTFDSGEQMMYFKPMLNDTSLKLVQEITPNTAESKMMQYSAIWNNSKEYIVQIGMSPVRIMNLTEKNELSYMFSLFRVNAEANYYAIDEESGEIIGSTNTDCVGKNLTEIGLSLDRIINNKNGFHNNVNGSYSFCVFKKIDTNYIGRIVSCSDLYQRIPTFVIVLALGLAIITIILNYAVTKHMNKYVVDCIDDVNKKLTMIANGNFDQTVDIQSSKELSDLSKYINVMVKSLLENNRKMSYAISKTNMYMGTYEYNNNIEKVRFTEYIPKIFLIDNAKAEQLSYNQEMFREFIDKIRENPVPNETDTFQISIQPERYVKIAELNEDDGIFGVAIDVTDEILRRRTIEAERDIDPLTGLYNRRGLESRVVPLLGCPEKLGYSAVIMIDADGLKVINDTYGHETGDIYLQKIAETIQNFGTKSSLSARLGGDEFVLFLYGYEDKNELINALSALKYIQNNGSAHISENLHIPLRFSFGYSTVNKTTNYQELLKIADIKMYEDKRCRKNI